MARQSAKEREAQIERTMKALEVTREEALEILAEDDEIDKGADLHPLTAEQEKVVKKMRQADRKPTVYNWQKKRERKPNELKREIIDDLFGFFCENWPEVAENGNIVNPERQIDFELGGESFSITLTQHRKPKA